MDYNKHIKDKRYIAGATVILLVLLGGIGYLSPYFFDYSWSQRDNTAQFVVVERGDEIHVQIANRHTGYTRYKLDNDWLSTYAGKTYIAKSRYRPCYFKTYGEDEWVCLNRKASQIKTSYEEQDNKIVLIRETPYYAYDYNSGSGGVLTERYIFGKDTYTQKVYFIPKNLNRVHKINYHIELDKDITFGREMDNIKEMFHKQIPVTLDYNDIANKIIKTRYGQKLINYEIDCGKGDCVIDPAFGIATSRFGLGLHKVPRWDNKLSKWSFRVGMRIMANATQNLSLGDIVNVTVDLQDYLDKMGAIPHIPVNDDTVLAIDFETGNATHVYDKSNNNNDGLITGATETYRGKQGKGYEFDGDDDKIDCGNNNNLDIIDNLTISLWVKDIINNYAMDENKITNYLIGNWTQQTTGGHTADYFYAFRINATDTGYAESITYYPGTENYNVKHISAAIYTDNSGQPHKLLGTTEEKTGVIKRGNWTTYNINSSKPLLNETDIYWIVVWSDYAWRTCKNAASGVPTWGYKLAAYNGSFPENINGGFTLSPRGICAYISLSKNATIISERLNSANLGDIYIENIKYDGTVGDLSFTINNGTLPIGLRLKTDGIIVGVPTLIGTYNFNVNLTDTVSSNARDFQIVVTNFTSYWKEYQRNPIIPGKIRDVVKASVLYYQFEEDNPIASNWSVYIRNSTDGINWGAYTDDRHRIFDYGGVNTFDEWGQADPTVYYDKDKSVFHMWFDALNASGFWDAFGYANSTDGFTWWKKNEFIMQHNSSVGNWEEGGIHHPNVLKHDGTYYMYYTGDTIGDGLAWRNIGVATSTDGLTWTKYTNNPVINESVKSRPAKPIIINGVWYMHYWVSDGTISRTLLATSTDGLVWTKQTGTDILLGDMGYWGNDSSTQSVSTIKEGNIVKSWISIKNNPTGSYSTGYFIRVLESELTGKGEDAYGIRIDEQGNLIGHINDNVVTGKYSMGWKHISIIYDSSDLKLYINNVLVDNLTLTEPINTSTNNFIIGENIIGIIDEVQIWNRSLTALEIGTYYNLTKNSYEIDTYSLRVSRHSYTGGILNSTIDYVVDE